MKTINDLNELENVEDGEVVVIEEQSFFKAHKKEIIIGLCLLGAAAIGAGVYVAHRNKQGELYLEAQQNDYSATDNNGIEARIEEKIF